MVSTNNADLLITLVKAHLKTKGVERGTVEYLEKLEGVIEEYV